MPYNWNNQFPILGDIAQVAGVLCMFGNLAAVIALSLIPKTRWIGLGILAAMAVSFVLTIIAGIVFTIICFNAES